MTITMKLTHDTYAYSSNNLYKQFKHLKNNCLVSKSYRKKKVGNEQIIIIITINAIP